MGYDMNVKGIAEGYGAAVGRPYHDPVRPRAVNQALARALAWEYERVQHLPGRLEVRAAYRALILETRAQFDYAAAAGIRFRFGKGYPDSAAMRAAVKAGELEVFPTAEGFDASAGPGNPMLEDSGIRWDGRPVLVNDIFRAVHDVYGHCVTGSGFGPVGEEWAFRAHAGLFSPLALRALTTETRGQNSWVNFGPYGERNRSFPLETVYAVQKTGLMPQWASYVWRDE